MYNTVAELNETLTLLYNEYYTKRKPIEDMFDEVYANQMASYTTLDEQWEVYKQCKAIQLNSGWWDYDDYVVHDFIIHYDVMEQEIKEPYDYNLVDWITWDNDDDEYISRSAILEFFENAENIEVKDYNRTTQQYITIKVPKHVIDTWKEMLIKRQTGSIHVPRYL